MRPKTIFKILRTMGPRTILKMARTILAYSARKYYPCSVCGGVSFKKIFEAGIFYTKKIACVCKNCGAVCLNPRMEEKGNVDYYQHWYCGYAQEGSTLSSRVKGNKPYGDDEIRLPTSRAVWIFNNLKDYLSKDSKIIDMGCGAGEILAVLKEHGFNNLTGVEPSRECCNRLKTYYDIDCIQGTLLTFSCSEQYDCIVLSAVLEHLSDPRKALDKIRSILKPNGIIYLLVPDLFGYEDKFSPFWFAHTFYPSKESLRMLLNNTGFQIEKYFEGNKDEQHLIAKKIASEEQWPPQIKENLEEYKKVIEYFSNPA